MAGGGLRGGGAQRGGLPLGAAAHALAVGGQAAGLRAQRAQLRQRVRVRGLERLRAAAASFSLFFCASVIPVRGRPEVSAHAAHSARTIRWPLDFQ